MGGAPIGEIMLGEYPAEGFGVVTEPTVPPVTAASITMLNASYISATNGNASNIPATALGASF